MVTLHEAIPVLELPDPTGRRISTWDYKHDRALVLVFADHDWDVVRDFARRNGEYDSANGQVLAVVANVPDDGVPFPVMIDADGSVSLRYVERAPAVLVTDAFGVLEGRFEGRFPDHEAILALIARLEMRCDECGVPEWPLDGS